MSPEGGKEPTGALAEQIARDFASFDRFKQHFSAAAEKVEAVGWAILIWSPRSRRPAAMKEELGRQGINVSVANIASTRLDMEERGITDLARASVHYYNSADELDRFCQAVNAIS